MKSKFLIGLILAFACGAAAAQTMTTATCPTAAPGTVWAKGQWLPCPAVVYAAVPVPANAIVANMRGGAVFSWMLATNVQAKDGVWNKSTAFPAGSWLNAVPPNFSIATSTPPVTTPYTATATLTWTAPTQNVDGSPAALSLYAFNVYSGPSAAALTKLASVGQATLTWSGQIGVGTTYFAVTAVNPSGESAKSAIVSKTVAAPTLAVPKPPVINNTPVTISPNP